MPAEGTGLPIVGAEIAGKYRIESILGQGGMGAVYAARNVMTGKRVAIKWLLPEHAASNTRERLLREAQCAASIDHPNVVDIYDVGEHEGGLFLVMEYLRGKPLSDVLAERGRLDPDELVAMLVPAMRGVHAAHQAGVIHRDLKPENILLSESDGQIVPKVVDFGVSKNVGASAMPNSSLTRTGALVGTPHYMALEQVDGSNAIDSRTDVYAFGVLLYRALTGHFPFDGTSLGEVILKIGTKEAAPMRTLRPELPLGLDTLVLRALSRDRTKRFGDLEELARGLSQFANWRTGSESLDPSMTPGAMAFRPFGAASAESVSGGQTPSSARATPPIGPGLQKRRRTLLIAGVAALSMLLTGAYLTLRNSADAPLATPLPASGKPMHQSLGAVRSAVLPAPAAAVPALGALAQQPGVATAGALPTSILDGKDGPEQLDAANALEQVAVEAPAAEPVHNNAAAPTQRAEKSRSTSERNNAKRNEARTPSAGRKSQSHGSGVVPGERTNGFSV
ncbi:MAG: serine/threonine protein kinase, partial [Myxococcaceae bacterium]|nr:serine/threonine protein kinase [Myxococcaceae bacterium]